MVSAFGNELFIMTFIVGDTVKTMKIAGPTLNKKVKLFQ